MASWGRVQLFCSLVWLQTAYYYVLNYTHSHALAFSILIQIDANGPVSALHAITITNWLPPHRADEEG